MPLFFMLAQRFTDEETRRRETQGGVHLAMFVSRNNGRFFVHILTSGKFRTRHLVIKLAQPIQRRTVTACAVLPYLWLEGTTQHPSARNITRYADGLYGTSIRTSIGKRGDRHVLEVAASFPEPATVADAEDVAEKVEALAFELFTDPLLGDAGFAEAHVERERQLHKKRIQSVFDDKIAYAMERCLQELARDSAAGLPRLGFLEDVDALAAEELWQIHQELLACAEVHVYVVGALPDAEQAAARILERLAVLLGPGETVRQPHVRALIPVERAVHHVSEQQSVLQAKLNLGYRTGVSYADNDYLTTLVCNGILGGFPHSKLFLNVREKASLAYYAWSRLDALTGVVTVQTGIHPDQYDRALEIVLRQVAALQDGAVTSDELEFTRRGLRNQWLQLLDQPLAIVESHFNGVLTGNIRDVADMIEGLDSIQIEDVVRAAGRLRLDTVYLLGQKEAAARAHS